MKKTLARFHLSQISCSLLLMEILLSGKLLLAIIRVIDSFKELYDDIKYEGSSPEVVLICYTNGHGLPNI